MFIVITASPNVDGLTAACARAAMDGIADAGGQGEWIDLCRAEISACRVCGNGWGICREQHRCVIEDCLGELQRKLHEADGIFLITPVYWSQQSERMKSFMDRFRRCEALRGEESAVYNQKINLVAAAGGSGNGTAPCLVEMENWCRHVRAVPHQRFGITRFNRGAMLAAIAQAAVDMVKESGAPA